ncbi:hypothetical protein K402DRAFT_485 [Aulographum hederae CBS 113979]|uniref:Uncharacterized protein n=1 Tax=Aulographum hederae CBS 113979 TaxID=1176131 RepID=A0A6G1HG76_9PEZI|nr:hypothetical protein K402DRAFT_485 [Aulographum hederae CBS 113979]
MFLTAFPQASSSNSRSCPRPKHLYITTGFSARPRTPPYQPVRSEVPPVGSGITRLKIIKYHADALHDELLLWVMLEHGTKAIKEKGDETLPSDATLRKRKQSALELRARNAYIAAGQPQGPLPGNGKPPKQYYQNEKTKYEQECKDFANGIQTPEVSAIPHNTCLTPLLASSVRFSSPAGRLAPFSLALAPLDPELLALDSAPGPLASGALIEDTTILPSPAARPQNAPSQHMDVGPPTVRIPSPPASVREPTPDFDLEEFQASFQAKVNAMPDFQRKEPPKPPSSAALWEAAAARPQKRKREDSFLDDVVITEPAKKQCREESRCWENEPWTAGMQALRDAVTIRPAEYDDDGSESESESKDEDEDNDEPPTQLEPISQEWEDQVVQFPAGAGVLEIEVERHEEGEYEVEIEELEKDYTIMVKWEPDLELDVEVVVPEEVDVTKYCEIVEIPVERMPEISSSRYP